MQAAVGGDGPDAVGGQRGQAARVPVCSAVDRYPGAGGQQQCNQGGRHGFAPAPGGAGWERLRRFRRNGRCGRRRRDGRVLSQHRLVQLLQRRAGLHPELVIEHLPQGAVGRQGVSLPPGSVQREHPLRLHLLA